jgi:hypothetical protein
VSSETITTAADPHAPQPGPDDLKSLLSRLRRGVRAYLWGRGVGRLIVWLGVVLWVWLALDWFFEPARDVRVGLLVIAALVIGWLVERLLLRQVFVSLPDRSMAMVIERHYRVLQDTLVTAVELDDDPKHLAPFTREMLDDTRRAAARMAGAVELRHVFNYSPLVASSLAACGLLLSFGIFALVAPASFRVGMARLALADVAWPRQSLLVIEGFPKGEAVVAKGGDLTIIVKADMHKIVPKVVEVRYRNEQGARERKPMVREGNAVPGRDRYQHFEYTFQNVLAPLEFEVRGGDARLHRLRVRVVDSPTIATRLYCEYPAYTGLAPRELPLAASLPIPRGSRATIRATANKNLDRVQASETTAARSGDLEQVPLADPRRFEYTIPRLDVDTTIAFMLLDHDGISNRDPVRIALAATPDVAPQVNVRPSGIGTAITVRARVPLAGQIDDDYGISKAWIDYAANGAKAAQQPLKLAGSMPVQLRIDTALEIAPLGLKPGQKLNLGVQAADFCRMPEHPEPNVGQGERFLLDVVTPEQLRAMLEARELNLRQRFETILGEVVETRDSLSELELGEPKADAAQKSQPGRNRAVAREPGDAPEAAANSPERRLERSRLRVERAVQNGQKNAEEVAGVATAFDGIREELINNRVDTEELRIRLKDNIADPLRIVAQQMFPELEKRLQTLNQSLPLAAAQVLPARQAAAEQADAIVVAMQRARDRMLELETFNEALDLLRAIIDQQKNVTEETKKQRAEQVRKLLED